MNLESLEPVMMAIAEAESLDRILRKVVDGIGKVTDLALARLWLLQKDTECPICSAQGLKTEIRALHMVASSGSSRLPENAALTDNIAGNFHRMQLGERKIGEIARSGIPLLIPGVNPSMPWVSDPEWISSEGVQSFAGQPLIFRGEILGVLAVFSRTAFTEQDFAWLRAFAGHAAFAISNARAFEQLERLRLRLEHENQHLHEEIKDTLQLGDGEIVGESASLKKVMEQVKLVAQTDATVLILGESGTGKEVVARAIHEVSPRREQPFIKVNCGAIPTELFESEFFGHVKGAFTGAVKDRPGRFELADRGDLFLDEIGEIPLPLQAKLLRVLQERSFERVGGSTSRTVDVRIVAATNRNLEEAVRTGSFREDLYYRLTVFPIQLPALRARKEDIRPLALHLLRKISHRLGQKTPRLTEANLKELMAHDWPGNVRELENALERATILSKQTGRLELAFRTQQSLKPAHNNRSSIPTPQEDQAIQTQDQLRQREVENILAALEKTAGKVFGKDGAAQMLGMRPTTLASRLKALGIRRKFVPETNEK